MALTPKQKAFVSEFYNTDFFKVWNYKMINKPVNVIINCFAILIGDYKAYRKRAALLVLKILVREDFLNKVIYEGTYPFERNDPRVNEWRKEVLSKGKCARCSSTNHLEAHHVLYWSEYPRGRVDTSNGMCLCSHCHANIHKGEKCEKLILGRI